MSEGQEDNVAARGRLEASVNTCRKLYAEQKFSECVVRLEQECLSNAAVLRGATFLAELHLLLAKCYRGMNDYKSAVLSCNSAIENRPHWKDPHLVRSSCFQAWHSRQAFIYCIVLLLSRAGFFPDILKKIELHIRI